MKNNDFSLITNSKGLFSDLVFTNPYGPIDKGDILKYDTLSRSYKLHKQCGADGTISGLAWTERLDATMNLETVISKVKSGLLKPRVVKIPEKIIGDLKLFIDKSIQQYDQRTKDCLDNNKLQIKSAVECAQEIEVLENLLLFAQAIKSIVDGETEVNSNGEIVNE